MPETMHSHILCTHFRTPATLSEIHTCAKLHSRASFGRSGPKSSSENPSRIHGPYFINITLHVCILIKFSTFFSCTFCLVSLAISLLALFCTLRVAETSTANSLCAVSFFFRCSLSSFRLIFVCIFMCF